jgi:hypothetical protein
MLHAFLWAALASAAPQAEKTDAKWLTRYSDALKAAQAQGKPVVIDAGRKG